MTTSMNSSSSSTGVSESATVKLNLPPSLVFLISNIHSFVTIKLDSHNYVLWRTQIEHALKANNFFGYVDGSIQCPSASSVRTSEITISEPDIIFWKIIDSQLVSCIIATLSATTLPLILGLDHASQVWEILEHRFNSVSRTHVHDLKRRLYNVTKTSTLEAYFDTIKQLSYKLAAAGAPVSEEDLIFYTLHGLPSEFDPMQTALSARVGDISFEELITVTVLNGEEMRRNRSSANTNLSTSVFVATPSVHTSGPSVQLPLQQGSTSGFSNVQQQQGSPLQQMSQTQGYNTAQLGHPSHSSQPVLQMGAPSQHHSPMFVAPYPQQYNNFRNTNRPRGFRNSTGYRNNGNNGSRPTCQICDKTNHTAKDCHHRLNLHYQPGSYNTAVFSQTYPQAHMMQYQSPSLQAPGNGVSFMQTPGNGTNFQVPSPNLSSGLLPTPFSSLPQTPQAYFTPPSSSPYLCPSPSYPPLPQPQSNHSTLTPSTSGNWFLDSGATHHVTNELNNLSLTQPYTGHTGVTVGNGHSLPISSTGQNNQPDSSPGSFSPGVVSNSALY